MIRDAGTKNLGLIDLIDRILDKGVVICGDITLCLANVQLLQLKINLVIASIETAKRYGLQLPWEIWEREDRERENRERIRSIPVEVE